MFNHLWRDVIFRAYAYWPIVSKLASELIAANHSFCHAKLFSSVWPLSEKSVLILLFATPKMSLKITAEKIGLQIVICS